MERNREAEAAEARMQVELSPVYTGLYWDVEIFVGGRKYAEVYTHARSEQEAIAQAEAFFELSE